MRAEDPRPEPDIEWPGLAADIDGRRDMANAILADQSGADRGEARKGTSRRGYYRAQFESAWERYCAEGVTPSQPSHTLATVEPSQLSPAGGYRGISVPRHEAESVIASSLAAICLSVQNSPKRRESCRIQEEGLLVNEEWKNLWYEGEPCGILPELGALR